MVDSPSPVSQLTERRSAMSDRASPLQHLKAVLSPAVSFSPLQHLDTSEGQSEMTASLRKDRLSRRATFAPDVIDLTTSHQPSLSSSMRKQSVLRKESSIFRPESTLSRESTPSRELSTLSREHSTLSSQHNTVSRDSSLIREPSPHKQPTLRKEASLHKNFSLRRQPSVSTSHSDKFTKRQQDAKLHSAVSGNLSSADAAGHAKSSSSSHKPHKLSRKASLAPAKPQKIEDVLDDFKLAIERKARMGAGSEGEHAQGLESAFKKLAVNWVVNAFVCA